MVVVSHLGEVTVDGVEAEFVFQTEDEDDRVDPLGELAWKSLILRWNYNFVLICSIKTRFKKHLL